MATCQADGAEYAWLASLPVPYCSRSHQPPLYHKLACSQPMNMLNNPLFGQCDLPWIGLPRVANTKNRVGGFAIMCISFISACCYTLPTSLPFSLAFSPHASISVPLSFLFTLFLKWESDHDFSFQLVTLSHTRGISSVICWSEYLKCKIWVVGVFGFFFPLLGMRFGTVCLEMDFETTGVSFHCVFTGIRVTRFLKL